MTYSWPLSTWSLIWIMLSIIYVLYIYIYTHTHTHTHLILIIWLPLPSVQNSTPNNVLKPKNMTWMTGIFWSFLSIPVKKNSSKSFRGRSRYDFLAPAYMWNRSDPVTSNLCQTIKKIHTDASWTFSKCSVLIAFYFISILHWRHQTTHQSSIDGGTKLCTSFYIFLLCCRVSSSTHRGGWSHRPI